MKHRGQAHEFALYVSALAEDKKKGDLFLLDDADIVHRISRVLRLDLNDQLILFDKQRHYLVLIEAIDKRTVQARVIASALHEAFPSHVTLLLPLIKREALEQSVYSAVELGASHIQLVLTQKVQRTWQDKELTRLEHVMIAAAEQSKNFILPAIAKPVPLRTAALSGKTFFFEAQGISYTKTLSEGMSRNAYTIIVGPEGDLTDDEKLYLQQQQVSFVCLTPTILRVQQAVALAIGVLRSFENT